MAADLFAKKNIFFHRTSAVADFPQTLFLMPYTDRLRVRLNGWLAPTNPIKSHASKKFMLLTGLYRLTCENWEHGTDQATETSRNAHFPPALICEMKYS